MDFNRQNMQSGTPSPAPTHTQPSQSAGVSVSKSKGKKVKLGHNPVGWGLLLIAVVLIVFGLLWFFNVNQGSSEYSEVNKKEYQAIFLTNGQVYFGHLQSYNSQYAKLTDIYYLQANQSVQPKDDSSSSNDQANKNMQLVKLGNEIHGPEDAMQISARQILFWENLKKDGKVTQAIKQYKSGGGSSTPNNTSAGSNSQQSASDNANASSADTNSSDNATASGQ